MSLFSVFRRPMLAIVPALLVASACSKKEAETIIPAPDQGYIQLVQAAPYNQVKIDLYSDDAKIGDAEYGRPSGYKAVGIGNRGIRVKVNSNSADYFLGGGFVQTVEKDKRYTVYGYNTTANDVGRVVTTDDQTAPATNKANVRFVNLGYAAGNVTLTYTGAGAVPIATNIAEGTFSSFVSKDAQTYNFELRDAGGTTLVTKTGVVFASGKIYTVLLRGRNSASVPPADQLTLEVIPNN